MFVVINVWLPATTTPLIREEEEDIVMIGGRAEVGVAEDNRPALMFDETTALFCSNTLHSVSPPPTSEI